MRRAFESELRRTKDGRDVLFPEFSGFGVALESMQDRQDQRAVQFDFEPMLIPIGVGVIDGDKSGRLRGRRVRIRILSITTINFAISKSSSSSPCRAGS